MSRRRKRKKPKMPRRFQKAWIIMINNQKENYIGKSMLRSSLPK